MSQENYKKHQDQEKQIHNFTGRYLGNWVYGSLDGVVTTFAIVAGSLGASLSLNIILILGLANLLADGISMAASSYLATKTERDFYRKEMERELWEMENMPDAEIEEIREIYEKKGFKGKDLDRAVEIITSDKEVWLKTMMIEELNLFLDVRTPIRTGLVTFLAFITMGSLPLLIYFMSVTFLGGNNVMIATVALISATFFIIGSLRSLLISQRWYISGFEMLIVGGVASSVAYFIGFYLKMFLG